MEPSPAPLLVCGCQPPDTLCERGQAIVKLIRRTTMMQSQFDSTTAERHERNRLLSEWAEHIYQDAASAIALLPPRVL